MRIYLILLALCLCATSAWSDEQLILSGRYSCRPQFRTRPFDSAQAYQLSIHKKGQLQHLILSDAKGKKLVSLRHQDIFFLIQSGDLLPPSQWGYISIDVSEDFRKLELFVSVKEGPGTYQPHAFDCQAQGEVRVEVVELNQFDCSTPDGFLHYPKHRLSFTVRQLGNPSSVDLEGDEDLVRVTPHNSPVAHINENLQVGHRNGDLILTGDSDGLAYVSLRLLKKHDFAQGTLTYQDASGPRTTSHKSAVFCKRRRL